MKNDFVIQPLIGTAPWPVRAAGEQNSTPIDTMKHSSKFLIAALALASSAWMASAQPDDPPPDGQGPPPGGPPGPGMGRHRFPPPAIIGVLDANHDGVIDADEIANAATALKKLDKNGDGKLTLDELLAPPPRPGGTNDEPLVDAPPPGGPGGTNHPPVPPLVKALDANGDGIIDADEMANAPAALKSLDKNGDGQLTPDEFLPPRRFGRPGGPPPGGRQGPPPDAPAEQ